MVLPVSGEWLGMWRAAVRGRVHPACGDCRWVDVVAARDRRCRHLYVPFGLEINARGVPDGHHTDAKNCGPEGRFWMPRS
jgi:hypothetical protein